ncbi:MAG: hypothetical protein JSV86_01620 [Gemmatimonadota bacterium]|nr:MAG: hypothetical protein JSV86_01620 [Gemmatimonadota bacterium]
MKTHRYIGIVLALLACVTGVAQAQLATPSARSIALANSFMARARGYESPFWNAANLGLSDRPGWSVGLAGASAYLNNNSLSYGQITDLYGVYMDDATKSEILASIREDDPNKMFKLNADLGASVLGFSISRFAFGFGTVGALNFEITPDAAELLLFGNVGEDGTGRDFSLDGSHGEAWSFSGGYVSYAQPFTVPALDYLGLKFSIGATVKYGVAHGFARITDTGTNLTYDPLAADVQAELLSSDALDAGRLWAVDIGAAAEWDGLLVAGISLSNALLGVSWNEEEFELTQVTALADFEQTESTDTTYAWDELTPEKQAEIVEYLEQADVPKRLRLGLVFEAIPVLTVSADYVELIGGTLRSRWDRALSAGGELRLLDALPLRVGLATDFSHFAYTGGLGAYVGPVHLDLSVGRWGVVGGDGVVGAVSISIWPGSGY